MCGFKAAGRFQLNEHLADVHPLPRRVQNFGNFVVEDGNVVFSDEEGDDEEYDMTKDNEDNEDSEDSEDIEDSEEEGNEQRSLLGEAEETVQQDKEYVGGEDEEAGHQDVGEAEQTVQQHTEDVGGEDETGQQDEEEETAQQDKTGKEVETLEKMYPCNGCSSIFSFPLPLQLHIKNNHKGKLKCEECNYRANTVKVIEDHKKEFHSNMGVSLTETTGVDKGMELVAKVFDFGRKEKKETN